MYIRLNIFTQLLYRYFYNALYYHTAIVIKMLGIERINLVVRSIKHYISDKLSIALQKCVIYYVALRMFFVVFSVYYGIYHDNLNNYSTSAYLMVQYDPLRLI